MIRRASHWLNRHPILSMLAGWLLLVLIVLAFIPADPPYIEQQINRSKT